MKRLSRRHWLRLIGGGAVGVAGVPILMACGETEVATKEVPIETTVIKEVPVERVVIQEKIVTKEVEVPVATTVIKEVPVEKVVEKVIETERVIPALQPASGENVDVVTGFIPETFSEAPQWAALVQAGNAATYLGAAAKGAVGLPTAAANWQVWRHDAPGVHWARRPRQL